MSLGDQFSDSKGAMWRLQVKTSLGRRQATSWAYQFRVRRTAIETAQTPELHFAFVMRKDRVWHFLLLDRAVLRSYVMNSKMGTVAKEYRQFTIVYHGDDRLICSGIDLKNHLEDWATWPRL